MVPTYGIFDKSANHTKLYDRTITEFALLMPESKNAPTSSESYHNWHEVQFFFFFFFLLKRVVRDFEGGG